MSKPNHNWGKECATGEAPYLFRAWAAEDIGQAWILGVADT